MIGYRVVRTDCPEQDSFTSDILTYATSTSRL